MQSICTQYFIYLYTLKNNGIEDTFDHIGLCHEVIVYLFSAVRSKVKNIFIALIFGSSVSRIFSDIVYFSMERLPKTTLILIMILVLMSFLSFSYFTKPQNVIQFLITDATFHAKESKE